MSDKCPNDINKCPVGYSNTFSKNNLGVPTEYYGKTCGEISGIDPTSGKWNQSKFDSCVNLYNITQSINKLSNTVSSIYEKSDSQHNFNEDLPKRSSFTNSLTDNLKKNDSFLKRQVKTSDEVRKVNDNWNNLIGQLQETDDYITNDMNVKTRLAEINNESANEKGSTIMIILGAFSSLFISVLAWVGYSSGAISIQTMIGFFVTSIIVFFILAIGLNKYIMKNLKKISDKLEKDIVHKGDELNIQALEWVDSNCDCPDKANK